MVLQTVCQEPHLCMCVYFCLSSACYLHQHQILLPPEPMAVGLQMQKFHRIMPQPSKLHYLRKRQHASVKDSVIFFLKKRRKENSIALDFRIIS